MLTTIFIGRLLLLLLVPIISNAYGIPFQHINLSPSVQPAQPQFDTKILLGHVRLMSLSASISPSRAPHRRRVKPFLEPSIAPSPSPISQGPVAGHNSNTFPTYHHHHHHHRAETPAVSLSPSVVPGCGQICMEPFTSAPFGTPCSCVLPMKVRLIFGVSLYALFPVVNELEIEVAKGIYLEQSQVVITGANADDQNQERTAVDINLVPLGDKFDSTTAKLTYQRFLQNKVPLNRTLFGTYDVASISYPGLPYLPLSGGHRSSGPTGSAGSEFPITANLVNKSEKMNARTILIISASALVVLVFCTGAVFILFKCTKDSRPSDAVGPVFTPSTNKKCGPGSMLSSPKSSTSVSFVSAMPTSLLSVKTYSLVELEKATDNFSSKRVLGEGGFGRVYHGITEDGTEIAVKLLTRDTTNGDREFIAEVEMLSRLHHRNLVKLFGICVEGHTRCLVYEVVSNGSVESHLHGVDKRNEPLDWDARLKIALGAARGLAYLHEDSNPRVIHRDFKASNILLEDDFTPRVSDFGLAREATEGSQHISTRVMGTFGYVAPEYAMTGHLLVKSDVYSYGVVLLELLSGRIPVDMSRPQGQENLVTWARSLLTTREGLQELVDPTLAGTYEFNDMAKVAAIASMCVHPEVAHRPFMGEVVQALKLIYNDTDETGGDCCSQRESSALDSDLKGDSSWWNAGGLSYGQATSFMTMEYSSGPPEELENRTFSASSFDLERVSLPIKHGNRSGPLRTIRSKPSFYKLKGSMSEHGVLWSNGAGP